MAEEKSIQQQLAEETQVLNALYIKAEQRLALIGVEASISFQDRNRRNRELLFAKHGEHWRLLVRNPAIGQDEPLINASRAMRIDAAEHMEALYHTIANRAASVLAQIKTAAAQVEAAEKAALGGGRE
jgi:hypothetical protein